jgi:arginine N-succinyltransferase
MPRYPIYVPTLPDAAQQVIGVVHEDSEKASDILLEEGFAFKGYVDIFDAGPSVEARTSDLNTISNRQTSGFRVENTHPDTSLHIIASGKLDEFKATLANARYQADTHVLNITPAVQTTLQMQTGDDVNWIPI